MNEYIRGIFLLDETISFIIAELFNNTAGHGGNLPIDFYSEAGFCVQKGQDWAHRLEIKISKNSKRLACTDNPLTLYFFDIGLPGTLHTSLDGLIGRTQIGIHA